MPDNKNNKPSHTIADVANTLRNSNYTKMSVPQLYKYVKAGIIQGVPDSLYGMMVPDSETEKIKKIIIYLALNYNINQIKHFFDTGTEPPNLEEQKNALKALL